MSAMQSFAPGTLVHTRGREWIVLPESSENDLILRPLGGSEDEKTLIYLPLEAEPVKPASFPPPDPATASSRTAGLLLRDAMMMKLRSGAGPFRSLGSIAVEPRAYQMVPLMMALKHQTIRLLIADDVGVGKTIEGGLIAREMMDRGEIQRFTVLCPPHLCDQWQEELQNRFNIKAEVVRTATAGRLERGLPAGKSLFEAHPHTIVSLDYIKSDRRRDEFQRSCPEFVIVDEAHTCTKGQAASRHQRFTLLKGLSENPDRHMVLLTATPHSGDEDAFFTLLGLLDPEFEQLKSVGEQQRIVLREKLALHFVQRRRPDIQEWQDSSLFPDRFTREITYQLSGKWGRLFTDVLTYAREMVISAEGMDLRHQRMNWWAALALLRCISSSPRAAMQALRTRIAAVETTGLGIEELDEMAARTILDGEGQDELSWDDTVPGVDTGEDADYLRVLLSDAEDLQGTANDPKLATLAKELKALIADGFTPVVFCRYIATAHYLAEYLGQQRVFKNFEIKAITGELTPAEREEQVCLLREKGDKILVATDCLSEGINLQEQFNAVVHYDLSWNPTRHEQREGRVDRFGQKAKEVRTIMIYGEDNPVDGAVLDVILRKAEKIRKELGVLVPMPDDSNRITQAIMQSVLMRQGSVNPARNNQMTLALDVIENEVDQHWESVREKVARNCTIFAQRKLKPEDVLPEWHKALNALGDEDDVARFVSHAASRLSAALEPKGCAWWLPLDHLPLAVKEQLALSGMTKAQLIDFHYPPSAQAEFIHRTHPLVSVLADYLSEKGLEDESFEAVSRCGAILTADVSVRTTVLLLRLRIQLGLQRGGSRHIMLAEEAVAVALRGQGEIEPLSREDTLRLMQATPSGNPTAEARVRHVERALEMVVKIQPQLDRMAMDQAESLLEDHRRVRDAADAKGKYSVEAITPMDLIGVYVLVPQVNL